jgi:hypothetical protein
MLLCVVSAFQPKLTTDFARSLLIAGLLIAGGCSKNQGPATYEYLKEEHDLLARFTVENSHPAQIPLPQKPQLPSRYATKSEHREYARSSKAYPQQLVEYYTAVIASLKGQSAAYLSVQAQLGSIGASDVETRAVHLVASEERLLGDARIVFLDLAELYDRRRANLVRVGHSNLFDDIIIPAATGFAATGNVGGIAFGAFKGLVDTVGRDNAAKQEIADQFSQVKGSIDKTQRDAIDFQTERSQILASLSSKYSDLDWNFLKVAPIQETPP